MGGRREVEIEIEIDMATEMVIEMVVVRGVGCMQEVPLIIILTRSFSYGEQKDRKKEETERHRDGHILRAPPRSLCRQ